VTAALGKAGERPQILSWQWRRSALARSHSLQGGGALLGFWVLVAIVSHIWTPYPPMADGVGLPFSPPSLHHLFGTDRLGADIFSRTLAAASTDVGITVSVVATALVVGTVWGAIAGFYGGWFDAVTMRILEMINSFPSLLLAMLVISVAGTGILNVVFVVSLLPLPDYVRLSRAEIISKKTWQFAEAARMIGLRPQAVLFRHLVPNSMRPLLTFASINASWVTAIASGQDAVIAGQWWIAFFPGLAIFLLATAFHLVGDGLTDARGTGKN
jgi:peptide/nickel transport system permease protein